MRFSAMTSDALWETTTAGFGQVVTIIKTELEIQLGRGSDHWGVTLKDKRSRKLVARFRLDDVQMGRMLGTQAQTVEADLFVSPEHGRYQETMSTPVPITRELAYADFTPEGMREEIDRVCEPWLADGWVPDYPKSWNHHNYEGGAYTVTFRRWHDEPPSEEE